MVIYRARTCIFQTFNQQTRNQIYSPHSSITLQASVMIRFAVWRVMNQVIHRDLVWCIFPGQGFAGVRPRCGRHVSLLPHVNHRLVLAQ